MEYEPSDLDLQQFALPAFLLAELFTGMEVGRGDLNIPTEWRNLSVQMELRFLDERLCRFSP